MTLEMSAETQNGTLVIELAGELTQTETTNFKTWVKEQLEGSPAHVEVDCKDVQYIDSTGLGALIFLRKSVLDGSGELRLTSVSGWLLKFLQVTGLEETFVAARRESQP